MATLGTFVIPGWVLNNDDYNDVGGVEFCHHALDMWWTGRGTMMGWMQEESRSPNEIIINGCDAYHLDGFLIDFDSCRWDIKRRLSS